ncbi:hypothetical protein HN51_005002, partial [Arachis hypogaea]
MLVLIRRLAQYLKTSLSMDSLEMMTTKSSLVFQYKCIPLKRCLLTSIVLKYMLLHKK